MGWTGKILRVNLTRSQIERSPSIDLHHPISRLYEEAYHRYYRWPFYWKGGDDHLTTEALWRDMPPQPEGDPHLRSAQAVTGYRVQATDGPVGSVAGMMIHGRDWKIRELVIRPAPEAADEEVFLLPENVVRISCEEAALYIGLARNDLRQMAGGPA